ncbi:MAG: lipoyl synthase [Candidatus Omnitrophica bacterium]|nr:lipoyl synthase [Candidatus Omnitrophota bacterium]
MEQAIPSWIKKRVSSGGDSEKVRLLLRELSINTVCESAVCPNIYECFRKGYASFMILGNGCTRNCRFCGVSPLRKTVLPDAEEPEKIALAVKKLGMSYAVITSPTRDDLPDGGAGHFAAVAERIRRFNPETKIELLIPDFKGNAESLKKIFSSKPDVISHNIETTASLYPYVRPSSDYGTSINVLKEVKKNGFIAKSGFMLGLGEKREDVLSLMYELKGAGCDYLVIGQYLRPSKKALPVKEFVKESVFREMEETGKKIGFKNIFAGTFYRSSYMAEKLIQ